MMLKMHHPIIEGRENEELFWGTGEGLAQRKGAVALPVNPEDGCDTVILRYKFSWIERLKILLGQDLFCWLPTFQAPVQWPLLHVSDPVELENGEVLPYDPDLFRAETARGLESGDLVPSRTSAGESSYAMEPVFEYEMRKPVKQKLAEQKR